MAAAAAPGCAIVETGVTNPLPGMATIAVAPFFNLTAEPATNGRQFALAYYAELQKVPGFEVIPVGVTETALKNSGLDLDDPADAVVLATRLGADAVVVGAVTEFSPYYPPRIGMRTAWYAPEPHRFVPGPVTDPGLREAFKRAPYEATEGMKKRDRAWGWFKAQVPLIVRGQSPEEGAVVANGSRVLFEQKRSPVSVLPPPVPAPPMLPPTVVTSPPVVTPPPGGVEWPVEALTTPFVPVVHDPLRPVMSYTRLFDAADAEIAGLLRDEAQLTGDRRAGGWEAALHRAEDFIRFAARRMVIEMLSLHGGESKRRYVWVKQGKR